MKIWDVNKGQLIKSCSIGVDDIKKVTFAVNNSLIVANFGVKVVAFNLSGNVVNSITISEEEFPEVCGENKDTLVVFGERETKIYSIVDGKLLGSVETPKAGKVGHPTETAGE